MNMVFPKSLLDNIRLYAEPFTHHPPSIITRFSGDKDSLFPFEMDSDRGLGILLLCAALYRPGAETRAANIIAGLYSRMGNDIFKLNRIPFEKLQAELAGLPLAPDMEEQKRIPGILRSVCDFFYKAGSLQKWMVSTKDWERQTSELSAEIFWMGKHSKSRIKSRYFLWLTSFQADFSVRFPQALQFAWPVGEGHLRFRRNFLASRTHRSASAPEMQANFFTNLGREIFSEEPWKLFQPLDAYLRPEKEHEYLCRKVQKNCDSCPLVKSCPAAKYFIASKS